MPLIALGLVISVRLEPPYTAAAVVCAGAAKTAYILGGEYRCKESLLSRRRSQ
jgi:hypothetical protein